MLDLEADYFATQSKSRLKTKPEKGLTVDEPPQQTPEDPEPVQADAEEVVDKKDYFLMYPDSVPTRMYNGDYIVEENGKTHQLQIVNGVIRTDKLEIKTALIRAGFVFMYEKSQA